MPTYGWPFKGPWKVTCAYGVKGTAWKAGFHSGVDIVSDAAGGDGIVYPIAEGTVLRTAFSDAYGLYVSIAHPDGYISLYAHLTSYLVREAMHVTRDTVLGREGKTGNATGPHLHLEVHKGAYEYPSKINPEEFIREREPKLPEFNKQPTMFAVACLPAEFGVVKWGKGKRTTTIKNYACAPFQASWTVPVGNIIANGVTLAKNPALTTFWVNQDNTVGLGKVPPATARDALSGIPLVVGGKCITLKAAMSEGWDTSPLYATTHSIIGLGGDGLLHYFVFTSFMSGAEASWAEIQHIAVHLGMQWALLFDGGGSTILDIGGVNKIVSAGNRQLATLITFQRSQFS